MLGIFFRLGPILALTACGFQGQDIGDPITRNLRWFSYVGGEDIRAACQNGAPDRYRMVYNAVYETQFRTYDFDSAAKTLTVHVRGNDSGNLANASLSDPLNPWRTIQAQTPLSPQNYDAFIAALQNDGAFSPSPQGLRLATHTYYWTAAACRSGRFTFMAWAFPSKAFSALTFDRLLFAADPTGIAVEPARTLDFDPIWEDGKKTGHSIDFTLEVGADGLVL